MTHEGLDVYSLLLFQPLFPDCLFPLYPYPHHKGGNPDGLLGEVDRVDRVGRG